MQRPIKGRRICIICEGDEERDYINTLLNLNLVIITKSSFSLIYYSTFLFFMQYFCIKNIILYILCSKI